MQERNPFSFRSQTWFGVDQAKSSVAAFLQRAVQVIDGEADVVDSRSTLFQELSDRRVGFIRFEELDERLPCLEAIDPGPVAISQLSLGHSEDIAIE